MGPIENTLQELELGQKRTTKHSYLQHPVIRGCGHKYIAGAQPRHRNCQPCWVALFRNDERLAQVLEEAVKNIGVEGVIQIQGVKFVKHYNKYLELVEAYKRATGVE